MRADLNILARFAGRSVPRSEVLAWELRRAVIVARKLGIPASGDVVSLRHAIVERKLAMGHDELERTLATELWWSERAARLGAMISGGRRRLCSIELTSDRGSAELVPKWYERAISTGDEAPLLAACPDHYLSRTGRNGLQEVIETTGGAPLAVRMFFDSSDLTTLTSTPDPAFRTQWTGIARTADGTAIGGIRHLFQDDGDGFRVRLTVEFPLTTVGFMIRAHQWHLACEFSNWIEAANAG